VLNGPVGGEGGGESVSDPSSRVGVRRAMLRVKKGVRRR